MSKFIKLPLNNNNNTSIFILKELVLRVWTRSIGSEVVYKVTQHSSSIDSTYTTLATTEVMELLEDTTIIKG